MKHHCLRTSLAAVLAAVILMTGTMCLAAQPENFYLRYSSDHVVTGYSYIDGQTKSPRSVIVADGTVGIADEALMGLAESENIWFPHSLEWIGDRALSKDTALFEVVIPESVKTVGDAAFSQCRSLVEVDFYGVPESIAPNILEGCTSLKFILFEGTKAQWDALRIELPAGTRIMLDCRDFGGYVDGGTADPGNPSHTAIEPEIRIATQPLPGVEKLSLEINRDSGLVNAEGKALTLIEGIQASLSEEAAVTASTLRGNLSSVLRLEILCQNGSPTHEHTGIATGDRVAIYQSGSDTPLREATIIVADDVLGTGILDIAQLERLAKALNGSQPLDPIYAFAGCTQGCDGITIVDLVAMAAKLCAK